jgi:hypothetical protein
MSVGGLPEHTVQHMLAFMEKLRGMHEADPRGTRPLDAQSSPGTDSECPEKCLRA